MSTKYIHNCTIENHAIKVWFLKTLTSVVFDIKKKASSETQRRQDGGHGVTSGQGLITTLLSWPTTLLRHTTPTLAFWVCVWARAYIVWRNEQLTSQVTQSKSTTTLQNTCVSIVNPPPQPLTTLSQTADRSSRHVSSFVYRKCARQLCLSVIVFCSRNCCCSIDDEHNVRIISGGGRGN